MEIRGRHMEIRGHLRSTMLCVQRAVVWGSGALVEITHRGQLEGRHLLCVPQTRFLKKGGVLQN